MIAADFYRAFEERHRGPRELIRKRLEAYQPFIAPLLGVYQPAHAIDLGCGRGEWLELLQSAGFMPQGVDLDAGMLAACTERGLPVTQGDAIAHLQSLGDESQCIVSGFHIAEHIAFDDLQTLGQHALRVLKPGGLLILETPNPENLVVGTSSFYLDPTHLRPIPPLLLAFLPEYYGFARVHTVRLQESAELHQRSNIRMMDVLGGVSPDYAVVAQKAASSEILKCFDTAFAARYGIELHELAERYDGARDQSLNAMDQRLNNVEAQAGEMTTVLDRIGALQGLMETHGRALDAQAQAQALEQRAFIAEASAHDKQKRIDELNANSHHWWLQASALEAERNALRQSWSWRITAPLRWAASLAAHPIATVRTGANQVIHSTINTAQRPLAHLMAAVLRRPQLSLRINQWLMRYPALHQQLLGVARQGGVVPGATVYLRNVQTVAQVTPELANLTPRARQIYAELKTAIQNNKRAD